MSSAVTRLHGLNPEITHEQLFKIAVDETATAWETTVKRVLEAVEQKTRHTHAEGYAKGTERSWQVVHGQGSQVQGQGTKPFEPLGRFRDMSLNDQRESLTPRATRSDVDVPTSHPWSTPQPYTEDTSRYGIPQEERGRTKVKTPERERNHRSWDPPAHSGLVPGLPTFIDPPALIRSLSTPDQSHRND